MPIIPNLNLIFIHIPKTGGSSINEFFNLKKLRNSNAVKGNFLCEKKLPGFIRGQFGNNFVYTSENLKKFLSNGDYIRIGDHLYQVHSERQINPKKIFLACVDNAYNIMGGNIAKQDAIFLGNNSKLTAYKKLVSDIYGNTIIPSKYHWGWIITKTKMGKNLKQVCGKGIVRESGFPALELDHVSLLYIKNRIDINSYNNMNKFCFVRNPYDRIVSEYFWKMQKQDKRFGLDCSNLTFKEFVLSLQEKWDTLLNQPHHVVSHFLPQYLFVCNENNDLIVDHVFKYEDGLEHGLEILFDNIGVKSNNPIQLPNNNSTKLSRKKYTEYYDDDTQAIIYSLYKLDFDIFGYSESFT